MADAQVEREKRKFHTVLVHSKTSGAIQPRKRDNATKSNLYSFFGSKQESFSSVVESDIDDPPISLTAEEMKELETLGLEEVRDADLSSDSKLCDVKFSLGSFKIDLLKHELQPLAKFQMGTVETSFLANADGSLILDFSLASLQMEDLVTLHSVFPSILRSLQSPTSSSNAFEFQLKKAKDGDQDIRLRMVAIELVASPLVMTEVKRFFDLKKATLPKPPTLLNPMLQQSIASGDFDLFFDADSGDTMTPPSILNETATAAAIATAQMSDKLSEALADAWTNKRKTKTKWVMDCNIHAPILVLPQSCSDPRATVLVFDLGNLRLISGNESYPKVKEWFESKTDAIPLGGLDIDNWKLELKDLKFLVGEAGSGDWMPTTMVSDNNVLLQKSQAIIEPLSITLDMGADNTYASKTRTCIFGVLPSVGFQISLEQVTNILLVVSIWSSIMDEMSDTGKGDDGISIIEESHNTEATKYLKSSITPTVEKLSDTSAKHLLEGYEHSDTVDVFDFLHASISLRKLSVKILSGNEDSIEAHLISVVASTTNSTDGSSSNKLRMGWFWILDRLQSKFSRRQRLVAHSSLPQRAESYAQNDIYNVMESLRSQGVFDDSYPGSADLADISLTSSMNKDDKEGILLKTFLIDAKFSSLFINWNPKAIQSLMSLKSTITNSLDTTAVNSIRVSNIPTSKPSQIRTFDKLLSSDAVSSDKDQTQASPSIIIIKAKMKKFEISLNSAKDDLPIFVMTMADTGVDLESTNTENPDLIAVLVVDDLTVDTPLGRTYDGYRTILGMAPNQSTSLLSVKYYMGTRAIEKCNVNGLNKEISQACAEVNLSPMRFVYIQSQVFALIEYLTEGILGSMTQSVACTAAAAAMEVAKSVDGEKLFYIVARGFDIVVPQSAVVPEYFTLHAGNLDVHFRSLANFAGSDIKLSLRQVQMACHKNIPMISTPIEIAVDAFLPPNEAPTIEERTIKADIVMSRASFLLSQEHYAQVMLILAKNIGERDTFLRDVDTQTSFTVDQKPFEIEESHKTPQQIATENDLAIQEMTHAGIVVLEIEKRIAMTFKIDHLALELIGEDEFDPILSLTAVETDISLNMLADQEKMVANVTLRNLLVEDRRLISVNRYFRTLVDQLQASDQNDLIGKSVPGSQDFLKIHYVKHYDDTSMECDIEVGENQFVLLPDVVVEVLKFTDISKYFVDESTHDTISLEEENIFTEEDDVESVRVLCGDETNGIEVAFIHKQIKMKSRTVKLSLRTLNCMFILVDIGSDGMLPKGSDSQSLSTKQLTETIVCQGKMDATVELVSETVSGDSISRDIQMQTEKAQIYVAQGHKLIFPVQILEPVSITVFLRTAALGVDGQDIDLKMVALSPIDVTFSMQNAALLSAIFSSIYDSFKTDLLDDTQEFRELSAQEASRIENLSSALVKTSNDWEGEGAGINNNSALDPSLHSLTETKKANTTVRISATISNSDVTIINDLQGIDQALFKIMGENVVFGGNIIIPGTEDFSRQGTFSFQLAATFLADYFDSSTNLWEQLLVKPWEFIVKIMRTKEKRFHSNRLNTSLDIDSHPLHISFSEQFLVSIGGAKKMWSMYSTAIEKATLKSASMPETLGSSALAMESKMLQSAQRKSSAANAARSFVKTMPYGIANYVGTKVHYSFRSGNALSTQRSLCNNGGVNYFRFQVPQCNGVGGKRTYGQDVEYPKSLDIYIGNTTIFIENLDSEVLKPRRAHDIGNDCYVFSRAVKTGQATIIYLSSHIHVHNCTNVPFSIALKNNDGIHDVGICHGRATNMWQGQKRNNSSLQSFLKSRSVNIDTMTTSKIPSSVGVPMDLLRGFTSGRGSCSDLALMISPSSCDDLFNDEPHKPSSHCKGKWGSLTLPPLDVLVKMATSNNPIKTSEILCGQIMDAASICAQLCIKSTLVDNSYPLLEIFVQPRCLLENKLPISLLVRTPMPNTFSLDFEKKKVSRGEVYKDKLQMVHKIDPNQFIEVFTQGPSIAISAKNADHPIAGPSVGWLDGQWIDIPLGKKRRLPELIRCLLPDLQKASGGVEFFISEEEDSNQNPSPVQKKHKSSDKHSTKVGKKSSLSLLRKPEDEVRVILFMVQNFAVDHTGHLLFEPYKEEQLAMSLAAGRKSSSKAYRASSFSPWSSFSSMAYNRRMTLLPGPTVPIRLVQLTMETSGGMRRSLPFTVEDISLSEGGLQSTAILWEGNFNSGYFTYRQLSHCNQFEIHVVPEFILFNGGSEEISIKRVDNIKEEFLLLPGKIAPIRKDSKNLLMIKLKFERLEASTLAVQVDTLGMRIAFLISKSSGVPVGSVAVQTVVGGKDSRFVVKIGCLKFGGRDLHGGRDQENSNDTNSISKSDFLRVRVRWSALELSLKDTGDFSSIGKEQNSSSVAKIIFESFTIDYQRIFKDHDVKYGSLVSAERSQLAVIIHSLRILDLTPDSRDPIAFESCAGNSFFDLRIRLNGPVDADLVKVDLIDLNMAYGKGKAEVIKIATGEDFIWRLIDVSHRIALAILDMTGFDLDLDWDEETGLYVISVVENSANTGLGVDDTGETYTPPRSDKLFDVKTARVSPISLLITFRRTPQRLRYKQLVKGTKGGKLMNYFTNRLKFTVENADIRFAGYIARNVKGPPDRIVEMVKAVYVSRVKFQIASLLKATNLQDWKYLTAREDGDDEFVEGDIVRLTGNMIGRSAGYVFKKVGQGLGDGVISVTGNVGNGIQKGTEMIGVGAVGASVNSVISGVGAGVGSTVKGVGKGAGSVLRGSVKGIGQIGGGVAGGAQLMIKGIGKGVFSGDGSHVVDGFSKGFISAGTGINQGVETAVTGSMDGVQTVGKGLFSGVMSVGKGLRDSLTVGEVKKKRKKWPQLK